MSLLSLLSSRLKGRLDENRELILYSSRPCLHTLPHYWSYYLTPLPVLLLPTPQFLLPHPPLPLTTSHIPGTMAHNMEHPPIIYLEAASKLDPTHHSYLFYSKFTFLPSSQTKKPYSLISYLTCLICSVICSHEPHQINCGRSIVHI